MPNVSQTINNLLRLQTGQQLKINNHLSKPGFSLIDILLASFILMVFLSILLIGSGSFLTTRRYSLQNAAAQIASNRIDYLRNQAKTNWATFNIPSTQNFTSSQISELSKLPQGSLVQTIAVYPPLPASPYPDVKQTNITVNWTENGNTRSAKFETLIYQYGIN